MSKYKDLCNEIGYEEATARYQNAADTRELIAKERRRSGNSQFSPCLSCKTLCYHSSGTCITCRQAARAKPR